MLSIDFVTNILHASLALKATMYKGGGHTGGREVETCS